MHACTPDAAAARLRLVLLCTMAVWGINLSAIKALTVQVDVLPLACLRMTLATAAIYLFSRGQPHALVRPSARQFATLLACSALMVYGIQVLALSGCG